MHKISFYVPEDDLENVKNALFEKGAGAIGNYEHCAWQTKGTGQYKAKQGANPHLGEIGKIETVSEYKVEMVMDDTVVESVIQTFKKAHPYETPAFQVIKLESF